MARELIPSAPTALSDLERHLLAQVAPEEVVGLLRSLIAIDTTETEERAVTLLAVLLEHEGIPYEVRDVLPGRPNLLVRLGTPDGRRLLFSCHTDTVPIGVGVGWSVPPLSGEVRNGRIYGRGATDNKGGVAAMVGALLGLKRAQIPLDGELLLTAVMGETQGHLGTRALAAQRLIADFAIVGEYSEGDKIAVAYRGGFWARLVVIGRTAHPGRTQLGADALRAVLDVLLPAFRSYRFTFRSHPLVPGPQLTITQLHAGERRNTLPDRCECTLDVRILPGQRVDEVWADLQAIVARAQVALPELRITFELLHAQEAFHTPGDHPEVKMLAKLRLKPTSK